MAIRTATRETGRIELQPTTHRHSVLTPTRRLWLLAALLVLLTVGAPARAMPQATYRIDHVTDGDTVVLRNGQKVRLVQIDTPEVFFGTECYGPQASAATKRLLPVGARVRLTVEPATDRVDAVRATPALRHPRRATASNVNIRLVAVGAAAPYFYDGSTGRVREPPRDAR